MPEYLLKTPDIKLLKEYQEAAEGNIRYITVSPEVAGVCEAIPDMRALGMTVAIGHSGADYETAWRCIRKRARPASTHTNECYEADASAFSGDYGRSAGIGYLLRGHL